MPSFEGQLKATRARRTDRVHRVARRLADADAELRAGREPVGLTDGTHQMITGLAARAGTCGDDIRITTEE